MSENKKSTRDAFGDQLLESSSKNENIYVLSADLAEATRAKAFKDAHPDRFFDTSISEANMIGVASGLAMHGKRVFCTSFATFITGRYDQIRASIAFQDVPVVIVGTHAGMAIGKDGPIHMSLEDISLMRALPNMTVLQPATYNEARAMVKWLCEVEHLPGPVYLRLGRQPVEEVFGEHSFTFRKIGCVGADISPSNHISIFTSGCVLSTVLACKDIIKKQGILSNIFNVSTLKPLHETGIRIAAQYSERIITVEDHSVIGGLGSAILEALSGESMVPVLRIGIDDVFPESGSPEDLYEKYNMTQIKIAKRILSWI